MKQNNLGQNCGLLALFLILTLRFASPTSLSSALALHWSVLLTEAGKSFGEIALMSEDATRNATIIADVDTDLLSIDRTLFNRCVKVSGILSHVKVIFVDLHPRPTLSRSFSSTFTYD